MLLDHHAKKVGWLALILVATSCRSGTRSAADVTRYSGTAQGPVAFSLQFHEGAQLLEETYGLFLQSGDHAVEVGPRGDRTVFLRAGPVTSHHEPPFPIVDVPAVWQHPVLGEARGSFPVYADGSRTISLVLWDHSLTTPSLEDARNGPQVFSEQESREMGILRDREPTDF